MLQISYAPNQVHLLITRVSARDEKPDWHYIQKDLSVYNIINVIVASKVITFYYVRTQNFLKKNSNHDLS
jgi:hypothetical protein